jgi:lipoate-protein ligase A
MSTGRLLIDPPLPGATNMARDESLLAGCEASSPITLRFYAWAAPTISLGYFQDIADFERLDTPAGDLDVVRRTTGGGAILHDLEVTYSLIVPIDHSLVRDRPNQLYVLAHEAIIDVIGSGLQMAQCSQLPPCGESSQRGPFFCFARRHALDVLLADPNGIAGYSKLAGSAQRRTRSAILQHGSIMLDTRFTQQPVATWKALVGRISFADAVGRLVPAFQERLGIKLDRKDWTSDELGRADRLQSKYASDAWSRERRVQ